MKRRAFVGGLAAATGFSALPWRLTLAADTPKSGGTLTVAYASDIHSGRFTLNREGPPGYETFWVSNNVHNQLVTLDHNYEIAPDLGRVDELFDDEPCGHEMNKRQEGLAQLLIPRGNTPKLFEVIEESFHLLT